jgi:hypothetical protein
VDQNEGKQQQVFTIVEPKTDTIPDLHVATLEELTSWY